MSLVPAAAVTAAGKTLLCATGAGSVECVIWGKNTSPIPNGTIATANFDVSSSAGTSSSLRITDVVASSPSAAGVPASGVGATLTLIHLSTLACNPKTLITPATASCTVNLTSASPSALTLALGHTSSIAQITMPGSITIPAGASSANFEVEVSAVAVPTTAIIVASLDGASVSFTLPLQPSSNHAPVISAVTAKSVTSSSATITWTTNKASSSQVAYGTTSAYGLMSVLGGTLVTSHSVALSGLAASTTYHYQVLSRDSQGNLASSGDFTLKTTANSVVLQIHANASEVRPVTNGSTVTPAIAPAGFTGNLVVNGTGSVHYTPAHAGNGVYFLNCCKNTNNAYYHFTGAGVGTAFNVSHGQITFYLKSRYSFAQRVARAAAPRYAFDVRDGKGNHMFYFLSQVTNGVLNFTYLIAGTGQYYWVRQGTEDSVYGNGPGVVLQVTMSWNNGVANLYLNGALAKSTTYTTPTANWPAASVFDLGAYEYQTFGGYNVSDDIIAEFTVTTLP
jgi:hypothetical protein